MRLIDYDEFKWQLTHWYDNKGWAHQVDKIVFNLMELDEAMEKTPTVEPVKHGHWVIRDNPRTEWYQITCSECGEDVTSSAPCIGFFPNAKVLWNYCPYCGAKNG